MATFPQQLGEDGNVHAHCSSRASSVGVKFVACALLARRWSVPFDGVPSAVETRVGECFELEFMGRVRGGYEWIPVCSSLSLICVNQQKLTPTPGRTAWFNQRFSFRALQAGEYQLTMLYKRRWETTVRDELVISVTAL